MHGRAESRQDGRKSDGRGVRGWLQGVPEEALLLPIRLVAEVLNSIVLRVGTELVIARTVEVDMRKEEGHVSDQTYREQSQHGDLCRNVLRRVLGRVNLRTNDVPYCITNREDGRGNYAFGFPREAACQASVQDHRCWSEPVHACTVHGRLGYIARVGRHDSCTRNGYDQAERAHNGWLDVP